MMTSSTLHGRIYSKISPHPRLVLESNIDMIDRNDHDDLTHTDDDLPNSRKEYRSTEQLICDHAALLLSIADIAQSEITQCPSALSDDDDDSQGSLQVSHHHRRITPSSLPSFPKHLDGDAYHQYTGCKPSLSLLPRQESLRHSMLLETTRPQRHRSVSLDSPTSVLKNIVQPWEASPLSSTKALISPGSSPLSGPSATPKHCRTPRLVDNDKEGKMTTPKRSNRSLGQQHHHNSGSYKKARIDSHHNGRTKKLLPQVSALLSPKFISSSSFTNTGTTAGTTTMQHHTALQGTPPSGATIRKVCRRKFSWKNYPQLEEFLINNRDAYLQHSALNYTIEQKNYNNTLTQDLLLLATKHGYIFDSTDFTFVTVRDRIRCYYKSYVQSAKKRGILMGYAAKKAGLLSSSKKYLHHPPSSSPHATYHIHENADDEDEIHRTMWSDDDTASTESH